jgi:hypothetical protein
MRTRPILDSNLQNVPPSAPTQSAQSPRLDESPLASQLPSWDLVPAHTLLTRRRAALRAPARTEAHPDLLPQPQQASQAAVQPLSGALATAFCQNCGSRLEEGSAFCADCGTKQG